MKKIFVSLILVLMLVSSIGLLSACKDKGYKLNNLANDYTASTENLNYVKIENNNIKIDYKGGNENKNYLNSTVSAVPPYSVLKSCEEILQNELIFVEHYVKICSNDEINVSAQNRDNLKSDLDSFKASLENLNSALASLDETIEVYYYENKQTNVACLSKFKTALVAYDNAFLAAEKFSDSLISIYFNNAIKDGNKNFIDVSVDNFNSADVINTLDSKIYFEITNLTKVFVEKYFSGNTIVNTLASNELGTFVSNYSAYNSKVSTLKSNYNVDSAIAKVNGTHKSEFYALAVQSYNAFELITKQQNNFNSAKARIDYCDVNGESSNVDIANKNVVNDFGNLTENYNQVLVDMLTLMGS